MEPYLEEINEYYYEHEDYFGEDGCYLTCNEQDIYELGNGKCLCYNCKCRQGYWYRVIGYSEEREDHFGRCVYPRNKKAL